MTSERMPAAPSLGLEIGAVVRIGAGPQRDLLDDPDACGFEALHLAGVVGEQPHFLLAELRQHGGRDREVALVVAEAETHIGIDRVEALVLKRISAKLVDEADAATFLAQVEQYSPARGDDRGERGV